MSIYLKISLIFKNITPSISGAVKTIILKFNDQVYNLAL